MKRFTSGIDHVGLTVKDVQRSADFFINVLGFEKLGERPDYPAVFVSDGSVRLTLWQAKGDQQVIEFDRHKNVGLHHLALRVENDRVLDELYETLRSTQNITIEFAPEFIGKGPSRHMMIYELNGIRIEFIARR